MSLTASQQIKMGELIGLIRAGNKRIVLKGSAGTGKTYMTNELIKVLKTTLYSYGAVYVTAPTHKALAVLKTKIDHKPYIHFKTIHSALQLKRVVDFKTGHQYYQKGPVNPKWPPFQSAQVVILDEGSMIGVDILDYIDEYPNLVFIFIGDPKQLNPVGEEDSPIFLGERTVVEWMPDYLEEGETSKKNMDDTYTIYTPYPTVELTEIIRQGAGNPIIDLSRNLNKIHSKIPMLTKEGHGYFYDNCRYTIIEKLAEANGTDDIKYLAWTNQDVDKMNFDVRKRIYGNPAKIELGESLVFASPYGDYTNNQEIKVNTLEIYEAIVEIPDERTTIQFSDGVGTIKKVFDSERIEVPSYEISKMKVYLINGDVRVLHEDCELEFKNHANMIKIGCKNGRIKWLVYYWFIERFAQVTYNHAITVHKSQGSTYKRAILNVGNLNLNKNKVEKQRLLYTGVTRASEKVVLYNVR